MQTIDSISNLVSDIHYKDWDVVLRFFDDGRPYIQVQFDAPCSNTGEMERQYCRKWVLSLHMTNSEIVRTAYKAIEGAVLHELQEDFKFREARVFSPHFDLEKMVDFYFDNERSKRT